MFSNRRAVLLVCLLSFLLFTLPLFAAGNFSISASPSSLSVSQGSQGTTTITTTISGGFNSSISLSASAVPPGVTVSFNPQTIPAPGAGSSTMTITAQRFTMLGTYPITVTGNGGGIKQTTIVTLTVTSPDSRTSPFRPHLLPSRSRQAPRAHRPSPPPSAADSTVPSASPPPERPWAWA